MKKEKNRNTLIRKKDIARFFFPSLAIVCAVCLLGCILDNALGITDYLFGSRERAESVVTDFFLVEVQVTFIVLSLSTVLSTRSKRVYWVDSFQYRLVRPRFTNFTALSSYILATLVIGTVCEILDRCIKDPCMLMGVLISFLLSVVLMIILSVRMIGANFGEEAIKAELEEELSKWKDGQELQEHIAYDAGLRIPMIRELVQVTFQEAEERQLGHVCENLSLLFRAGFPHELKRCYDYVSKALHSPEIMAQIDFTLMRNAVFSNEVSFFFGDCPLSLDSTLRWWDEMIDERFDDAILLWLGGRKEEARRIRKDLYAMFTRAVHYHVQWLDFEDYDLSERQILEILRLMGHFVERRMGYSAPIDSRGEFIELDEEWQTSEKELTDDTKVIEDAERLAAFAVRTLDSWKAGSCSEEYRMEREVFNLDRAKQF